MEKNYVKDGWIVNSFIIIFKHFTDICNYLFQFSKNNGTNKK